ncbi:MAG: SRPBCC family protein [Myxococcales bacterium]|jgi:hypothetical protein
MTEFNKLEPIGLDFFDRAPLRVETTMTARCAPEDLMETLRGDTVWTEWASALKKVEWTSPKPYGQNATRDVTLAGGMVVREIFFHWKENERVAFYVAESTIPKLDVFAEDYRIERIDDDHTKLTWVVAIRNRGFMTVFNPVMPYLLKLIFKGWLKSYKKILEARAAARQAVEAGAATASSQPTA